MSRKVRRCSLACVVAALVLLTGCASITRIQQDVMSVDVKRPLQWSAADGRKYDIVVGHGAGKPAARLALGKDGKPPFRYITDLLVYAVEEGKRGDPGAKKTAIQELGPAKPPIAVRVKLFSPASKLYFWTGSEWAEARLYDSDKPPSRNIRISGFKQDGQHVEFTIIAWPPEDTDTADG